MAGFRTFVSEAQRQHQSVQIDRNSLNRIEFIQKINITHSKHLYPHSFINVMLIYPRHRE
jgi:hypothetical protein